MCVREVCSNGSCVVSSKMTIHGAHNSPNGFGSILIAPKRQSRDWDGERGPEWSINPAEFKFEQITNAFLRYILILETFLQLSHVVFRNIL